jgi:hypothetical protein
MSIPTNISASRGAAILGLSKWQTPLSIWLKIKESIEPGFCAKNNYELPVVDDNASMRWGRAFESSIIELAEIKQNCKIINREKLFSYKNFITCHIDGEYEIAKIGHEGKTTNIFTFNDEWGAPGTDLVPIEYQVQCQHQMICTGWKKIILSVLVFPNRVEKFEEEGWIVEKYSVPSGKETKYRLFRKHTENDYDSWSPSRWTDVLTEMGYFNQYEIKANPKLQKRMIIDYTKWWNKYILNNKIPEPQSYDDIKALVRQPKGTVIANTEIENIMDERKQIKKELSGTGPLAKRAELIKVHVLDFMRKNGASAIDDDSVDKFILRDRSGRKLASYGKDKNGSYFFR